jgi:hypothetical protein
LPGLSEPGEALLGDCRDPMPADAQFRMGMSGLQGFQDLRSL